MTYKQRRFCEEYLIDCNAVAAYHRAGYKKSKNSRVDAWKLLNKSEIKEYIALRMEELNSVKVAETIEILEYLTSVMRGEAQSEIIVVEGKGSGYSQATAIMKYPDQMERLKAAELLGRRYGLFTGRLEMNEPVQIIFCGENELED